MKYVDLPLVLYGKRSKEPTLEAVTRADYPFPSATTHVMDDFVALSSDELDEGHLVLDGIGYSIHIRTSAVSADLEFASPKAESLRGVERALFSVCDDIARITARQDITDYLKTWRRYLS